MPCPRTTHNSRSLHTVLFSRRLCCLPFIRCLHCHSHLSSKSVFLFTSTYTKVITTIFQSKRSVFYLSRRKPTFCTKTWEILATTLENLVLDHLPPLMQSGLSCLILYPPQNFALPLKFSHQFLRSPSWYLAFSKLFLLEVAFFLCYSTLYM